MENPDLTNQINQEDENLEKNTQTKKEIKKEIKKELNKNQSKKKYNLKWPITAMIISFVISFSVGIMSEFLISGTGIILTLLLICIILAISIITDMIGVSVTASNVEPFMAMASKKIKGSKEAIKLIKNAEKYSSFFCDIIGDVCGTLAGALGASLTASLVINNEIVLAFVSAGISATIATITIFGKALGKKYAINKGNEIVYKLGKFISFFKKSK